MSTDSPQPATAGGQPGPATDQDAAEREFRARVAADGGQAPNEGPQQPPNDASATTVAAP